jgi:hypothetical protein
MLTFKTADPDPPGESVRVLGAMEADGSGVTIGPPGTGMAERETVPTKPSILAT